MGDVVILGGLGGGGDVGLALILARLAGLDPKGMVIASFLRCSVSRGRLEDLAVEGSLIRVPKDYFASPRVFEDKLPLLYPELEGRVYAVCTRDPWESMVHGLERLVEESGASCLLHADLGGDGVLLGYEPKLGSYKTDTIARALLAEIAERVNVRSIIASGCVGCEGGGGELSEEWLSASLLYAHKRGALVSLLDPPRGYDARDVEAILGLAESGMLPYYLAALRGEEKARIRMAYLSGEYPVKPWHRLVFLLDAQKHCSISPLCLHAKRRGEPALRGYEKSRPKPPSELAGILKLAKSRGPWHLFESLGRRIGPSKLRDICLR